MMGASAGGNLAAAATLLDRRNESNYIKLLILNYPYLDLATDPEEKGHKSDEILSYRLFAELYAEPERRKDSMISPVYASTEELENFPPVYIITAGDDVLRREGEKFADRVRNSGGKVQTYNAIGMPHGYLETWFKVTGDESDTENVFWAGNLKQLYENGKLRIEVERTCAFIKEAIEDTF